VRRFEEGPPIPQGPFPRAVKVPPEHTRVRAIEEIPGNEEFPEVPVGAVGQIVETNPWAAMAGYVYVQFGDDHYAADMEWLEVIS